MCTVSPSVDPSYPEGPNAEWENSLMRKDDHEQCKVNRCSKDNNELSPFETVDEEEVDVEKGAPAKLMSSPSAPSRQEMLEHSLTHFPFRSWCFHCVRGKCKSSKHSSTGGTEESAIPVVGFDYAFLSDRNIRRPDDDGDDVDEELHARPSDNMASVVVAHDSKSMTCAAIPVPHK